MLIRFNNIMENHYKFLNSVDAPRNKSSKRRVLHKKECKRERLYEYRQNKRMRTKELRKEDEYQTTMVQDTLLVGDLRCDLCQDDVDLIISKDNLNYKIDFPIPNHVYFCEMCYYKIGLLSRELERAKEKCDYIEELQIHVKLRILLGDLMGDYKSTSSRMMLQMSTKIRYYM